MRLPLSFLMLFLSFSFLYGQDYEIQLSQELIKSAHYSNLAEQAILGDQLEKASL